MTVVIVGAGPAGVRAAQALVRHGVRPVVLDEAPCWGGQIYRQQPPGFRRPGRELYGFEAGRARAVHEAMASILDQVDYRPGSLVWGAEPGQLDVLRDGRGGGRQPYEHLVLATGATDRVLPFEGWTLPGVYTLGGAQVALKFQGCAIGRRVVFVGTGPLLYLVAYQYAKAGATVAAVLDESRTGDKLAALPAMLRQPAVLAKGMYYAAWLRAHGVPVHEGVHVLRARGGDAVQAVHWQAHGQERQLACDAIGFGHALRSETQLADLLGCQFAYDEVQRAWLPQRDAQGRSSVPGIYLAGDGAGIQGADAAEAAGELAALALLRDLGRAVSLERMHALGQALARSAAFRRGLERAFPLRADWAAEAPDTLVVCRCEEITAGELRRGVAECGATELNRLKALTRVGMGRCQGRMCGAAAAEILAHACGQPVGQVGRLRAQAPVKPLPFAVLAARAGGEQA